MALLDEVKAVPVQETKKEFESEKVDVAIAWAMGEVRTSQVTKVTKMDTIHLYALLKYAVATGKLVRG